MTGVTHANELASAADSTFLDFTPTTDDLIRLARGSGRPGASISTIRHWRNQGLISAPFRHNGVWRYPLVAVAEVDLLARYGRRQLGDDVLEFARYIETKAGQLTAVKEVCVRLLTPFQQGAKEAADLAAGGPQAIRAAATELASKRGQNAFFPREVRMRKRERIDVHDYMLSKMLDAELADELESDGLAQLARGLGLRGHSTARCDIGDVLAGDQQWQFDPDTLIEAVRRATPELAELARRSVAIQHLWMPAMMSTLWAEIDAGDAALLRAAAAIAAHQSPAMYPLVYAAAVARKQHTLSEREITERFVGPDEATGVAAALLDSPDADRHLAHLAAALRPHPRVELRVAVARLRATF